MTRAPRFRPHRGGFSMLEVMVACALLAIGLLAVLTNMFTLSGVRQDVVAMAEAQRIAASLSERFAAAPFTSLRTAAAPWSYARPVPLPFGSVPAAATVPAEGVPEAGLRLQPMTLQDLATYGIVPRSDSTAAASSAGISLNGLQIFVEYHRAMSRFATAPMAGFRSTPANIEVDPVSGLKYGLLCEANPAKPTSPGQFWALVNNAVTKSQYYLRDETPAQVSALGSKDGAGVDHSYDAVMVRIMVVWRGPGDTTKDMIAYGSEPSGPRTVTMLPSRALPSRTSYYEYWTAVRPTW